VAILAAGRLCHVRLGERRFQRSPRYGRAMRALDAALPRFNVNEVHTIRLTCSPERAVDLALSAPAAPGRLVAALFRARGLPPDVTIEGLFDSMGFDTLTRTPTEVVVAASGTPWRLTGGIHPFAAARPGTVRIAADIRAVPAAGGCLLSTETRVHAVDDRARRAFRCYWLVVGPFSGLIRRRWLRAVEGRCP